MSSDQEHEEEVWDPSSDDNLDEFADMEFEEGTKLKAKGGTDADAELAADPRLQLMGLGIIVPWQHNEKVILRLADDGEFVWFRELEGQE